MRINRHIFLLVSLVFVFVVSRFFGFSQIYHQDEYRWASIANPFFSNLSSPHPPLAEYLYKVAGHVFGYGNIRIVPLVFSFFNLILVYLASLKITKNKNIALVAAGLFTVNIYSIIANLQIDIDGAILPFFILLSYYAYLRILENDSLRKWWFVLFGLAVTGGFLTKLSFLLFVAALLCDRALGDYHSKDGNVKKTVNRLWPWAVGFLILGLSFYYLYVSHLGKIIKYAEHFQSLNFNSRAYFDLVFKIFKAFVWLSPLLALPTLYGFFKKDILKKYQLLFIYLILNFIFYLVLFDFSTLTIERYFMFLIVPAVLISAQVIYDFLERHPINKRVYLVVGVAFILLYYVILSLHHGVLPLNPKTAYVNKVRSLDLRFLIPFTGGSGPSGFYFSALFIFLSWLISVIALAWATYFKKARGLFLVGFIVFGLGYNILFSTEYLFGTIYGSVDKVAKETIEYVNSNNAIKEVITYYDIGAYYLRLSGKYSSRFYTAPKRDYTPRLESYRGQYMIVDFPAIEKDGRYWPLISRCPLLKKFQDKKVESYVFDCSKI